VRVGPGSATISLHYLWDNALGQAQGIRAIWNRSGALVARPDLARDSFPDLQVMEWAGWVAESVQHARDTVYPGGMAGSRDRTNGLLLPPDYGKHAQGLAERQIVLAGYRLADLVTRLLKKD
jgi:S1/P1 nuclease